MRYFNPNLTLWENLCPFLIVCAVGGIAILIDHLIKKAKEKKAADSRKERH